MKTWSKRAGVLALLLAGAASGAGQTPAVTVPDGKLLVFNPRTRDLSEFERLARAARDAGFTHVVISELSGRTDLEGYDAGSPWCEWSTIMPALFKHATPPGLEDAYPEAFVRREAAFMKAKHDLAAGLGLRCAYYGVEPMWLRDAVYRRQPEWRGSRADNPLRTTGLFFAPNTDLPAVRAAYREAVRRILSDCPLIDIFQFVTNDSGAFYPWGNRLFVNPSGPTGFEHRDTGERVVGFLLALRAGAQDVGVDAWFYTDCGFTPDERYNILKNLQPGIGVACHAPAPFTVDGSIQGIGGWGGGMWLPDPLIDKLPTPMSVLEGVRAIRTSPVRRFTTGGNSLDYFSAFRAAMDMPVATTVRARVDVLHRMAEAVYSPETADMVMEAWDELERANLMMRTAGVNVINGPLLGRWLVRPLVAYPERLSADERAYWEPYLYQSPVAQPESYLDYLTILGTPEVRTWEEAARVCIPIDSIAATLAGAASRLERASALTADPAVRDKLMLDALRLRAQQCVTLTIRNTLQVGTLIRQRDLDNAQRPKDTVTEPGSPNLPKGDPGSTGLFFMHRALRRELDNTYELIRLMERAAEPLIFTERNPADEGSLFYGPNLLENLRRKADIMLRHWRTAEEGYYQPTRGG